MLYITLLIFGLSVGELISVLTILLAGLSSIVWINVELARLKTRLNELEKNINKDENVVIETARILKDSTLETARILKETAIETAKLLADVTEKTSVKREQQFDKTEQQFDKIDIKLDKIMDDVNEMRIDDAKNR
jgi:type II secretory pathway predicted ATPase ExeA